jgi:hypothetical protein
MTTRLQELLMKITRTSYGGLGFNFRCHGLQASQASRRDALHASMEQYIRIGAWLNTLQSYHVPLFNTQQVNMDLPATFNSLAAISNLSR